MFSATTIAVLAPVPCCYMTWFNYGGKKARNVVLTYRCHLSNIMPGSTFYDSMGWGMTQSLFPFLKCDNRRLPQYRRDEFSLITKNTNKRGEILSYNKLRQMGSIVSQWGFNSVTCLKIPNLGFHWGVLLF